MTAGFMSDLLSAAQYCEPAARAAAGAPTTALLLASAGLIGFSAWILRRSLR